MLERGSWFISRRSRLDEQTTEWLFYTARAEIIRRPRGAMSAQDIFERLRLVVARNPNGLEWMVEEAAWLLTSSSAHGRRSFTRTSAGDGDWRCLTYEALTRVATSIDRYTTLRRAAEAGNKLAQIHVAHRDGDLTVLRHHALSGDPMAQKFMIEHEDYDGTEEEKQQWCLRSAANGNRDAICNVVRHARVPRREWLEWAWRLKWWSPFATFDDRVSKMVKE